MSAEAEQKSELDLITDKVKEVMSSYVSQEKGQAYLMVIFDDKHNQLLSECSKSHMFKAIEAIANIEDISPLFNAVIAAQRLASIIGKI